MNTEQKSPVQIATRVAIVIGLVILLILLSIGIIRLVPKAIHGIANLKTTLLSKATSDEKINVVASPITYDSNTHGNITWTRTGGTDEGYFTFEYSCSNLNITLEKIVDASTESYSLLECGQPFIFDSATSSNNLLPIRALNASDAQGDSIITIAHRHTNSEEIYSEGTTTITVLPTSTETSTTTPNVVNEPEPTTVIPTPAPAPSNPPVVKYKGPADLIPQITQYIPTTVQGGQAAYKFQVTNIGQSGSGSWAFSANLPASSPQDQVFNSSLQSNIPAGKTSYFTLRFYPSTNNTYGQFRVIVDPLNYVHESNENNNQAVL